MIPERVGVYLDLDPNWKERRWIELWTRLNPDSIGYRKPRKEKDKGNHFRHLQMKMRSLFILYCFMSKQFRKTFVETFHLQRCAASFSLCGRRARDCERW